MCNTLVVPALNQNVTARRGMTTNSLLLQDTHVCVRAQTLMHGTNARDSEHAPLEGTRVCNMRTPRKSPLQRTPNNSKHMSAQSPVTTKSLLLQHTCVCARKHACTAPATANSCLGKGHDYAVHGLRKSLGLLIIQTTCLHSRRHGTRDSG